jgi:hypothetical protein
MAHPSPTSPEGQDRYRCPDRGGPGGQRCQLLIEHATPAHIASIGGTFRAWVDGAESTVPPPARTRGSCAFHGTRAS